MKLTLHSFRRCPFAIRVRMVLEEKGIPYERIEEDLSQLSEKLLALHPEGRVPLLIHETDDGREQVIYQSTVITEYLEEAFPNPALMPRDPSSRAQIRLWTYWCDSVFKPDLDLYKYELSSLDEKKAEELLTRLHAHLTRWESALADGRNFLIGSEMTLADIHLFPFARQFTRSKPPLPGIEKYSGFSRWLARMMDRPAFTRVMDQKKN